MDGAHYTAHHYEDLSQSLLSTAEIVIVRKVASNQVEQVFFTLNKYRNGQTNLIFPRDAVALATLPPLGALPGWKVSFNQCSTSK